MKDFAKSIRTGNAYTKGQVLGEEEGKKYVFGGEINGTYIVHRQPDGKTFSFSSEQEIKDWMRNSKIGNSSHTKEEAKTKDEYFKILKFYQTQGYRTKAGEYNPNGRIKLHKGDDSVEIVLVGNSKVGNEYKPDIRITPADLSRNLKQAKNISEIDDIDDEIEYDLREYENAIDECKLKIKDYERSMSALRMIQRDVSDARRNLKVGNSVPENLHERFGYRLAVTKDGDGKKQTISELEMSISDYKNEIAEKEKELNKDKQNLQKLEAVLRKYK